MSILASRYGVARPRAITALLQRLQTALPNVPVLEPEPVAAPSAKVRALKAIARRLRSNIEAWRPTYQGALRQGNAELAASVNGKLWLWETELSAVEMQIESIESAPVLVKVATPTASDWHAPDGGAAFGEVSAWQGDADKDRARFLIECPSSWACVLWERQGAGLHKRATLKSQSEAIECANAILETEAAAIPAAPVVSVAAPSKAASIEGLQVQRAQLRADLPFMRHYAANFDDGPTFAEIAALEARLNELDEMLCFEIDPLYDRARVAS